MRAYLAEKERLIRKYGLHQHFLSNRSPHQDFFLRWLLDNARDKDAAILDAGCGPGFLALRLHELGYDNYCGIDIKSARIEAAKELLTRFGIAPRLWVEDMEHTHFEDGRFDVVCVLDASYLKEFHMGPACREIHRILGPNGRLVMDITFKRMPFTHHVFTKGETRKHLSGFNDIEFREIDSKQRVKYGVVARKCG